MAQRLGSIVPWLLVVPLAWWIALPGAADTRAAIDGLTLKVDGHRVLVTLRLDQALGDDFERRVRSGLPTELIYHFELDRDRRRWFDESLARGTLQVVAMFNAKTDEYLVNFKYDGDLIESRVVRDVAEVRRQMTTLADFPTFNVAERNPEERLELRVRAELGTKTVLAFIPRTIQTDWVSSSQFRARDGQTASGVH